MGAGDSNASAKLTSLVTALGALPGIQLSHSGRKGSTDRQWLGGKPLGPEQFGWQVVGPSAIAFNDISPVPAELTIADVDQIVDDFASAAKRAAAAGYKVVELLAGSWRSCAVVPVGSGRLETPYRLK